MNVKPAEPAFREGDEIVLAHGAYVGTRGVFLRLNDDAD